ncbi:hypothetical protein [Acidocella sp.]|uniref:hypothetical protein n=1 Tax=Acidocella sp. TaxID=50710 RepID=UPI002F418B10
MDFTRADKNKAVAGLATGLALLALTSCNRHPPVVAAAPPPPVGHVYATQVELPPPVSPRIRFTSDEEEQAQQAFNVIGLKSALMVAALSCDDQTQYDAFMHTFQPDILADQHVMDAYFRKASGPYSGQKMEDNFVTLLANNQSVSGIGQGRPFCLNNQAEFTAVAALRTEVQLNTFVTDRAPGALPSAAPMVEVASAASAHHVYETRHVDTRHERDVHEVHHEVHVVVKHTVTKAKVTTKAATKGSSKVEATAQTASKKVVASQP